jgi:hypothetical protein
MGCLSVGLSGDDGYDGGRTGVGHVGKSDRVGNNVGAGARVYVAYACIVTGSYLGLYNTFWLLGSWLHTRVVKLPLKVHLWPWPVPIISGQLFIVLIYAGWAVWAAGAILWPRNAPNTRPAARTR